MGRAIYGRSILGPHWQPKLPHGASDLLEGTSAAQYALIIAWLKKVDPMTLEEIHVPTTTTSIRGVRGR